ncbi:M48 family metallopeptidase [Thiomicrorhabdus chilensis]|uniref:M48 family metallopeptidase n=1 Tax=Thiomicrorhabdus chilensis TaxID=63656 RepID=UPI0006890F40|nr:M48 family metallopeptidase [Thiomicrorhabdus chilensis]
MNFFVSQDRARKTTRWLVVLYVLALLALTTVSSWVLVLLLRGLGMHELPPHGAPFYALSERDWLVFLGVAVFVVAGALISSYIKGRELSKGGRTVALSLGGRKIPPNTADFNERRILNVVEEMAIASGMPVPEVYILPEETSINAFAAGLTPTDAIIGLTRGAIEKLDRAQLQGVVGHEFSHILNGDMRLNIRLIMLITGIEFVGLLGRIFTQSARTSRRGFSSRRRSGGGGAAAVVLAGVVLRLLGWFGVLFGRIIQAAVSRQREFLADASAVQFTRNPQSVADALKVIGGDVYGSRIRKSDVSQVTHLFFGQAFTTHFNFLFATHPALEKRIQLLDPTWRGEYLKPAVVEVSDKTEAQKNEDKKQEFMQTLATTAVLMEPLAGESLKHSEADDKFRKTLLMQIEEPTEAMALVLAVLLNADARSQNGMHSNTASEFELSIQAVIDEYGFQGLEQALKKSLAMVHKVELQARLPLVERAMPALKELSEAQYGRFKALMDGLIQLDHKADVFEQTLYRLVTRFLDVHFGLVSPYKVRYRRIHAVSVEIQLVMSMLADYGHADDSPLQAELAYQQGMQVVGLSSIERAQTTHYTPTDFDHAAEKLAHCSLVLKERIVQGLLACAHADGRLAEVERELILAIAATMDAPISRLKL